MAKKDETNAVNNEEKQAAELNKVILAACIVAVVFAVLFIALNREEPYSVVYIKSYSNYVNGNVSFTYVVESHEGKPSSYNSEVLFQNSTIQTDSFQIVSGSAERTVSFQIRNDTQFPAEVEVIVTVNEMDYSVHFWLLGSTKLATMTPPAQQPSEQQAVTTLTPPAQQPSEQQAPPSTAMALAAYAPWALGLLLLFIIASFLARRRKKKRKKKSR